MASASMVVFGIVIRMKIEETPDFAEVKAQNKTAALPVRDIVVDHMRPLLLTIGGKQAAVTLIYTIFVFSISYALSHLGFSSAQALNAVVIGSVFAIFSILFFGWVGEKIGVTRLYFSRTL